MLSPRSRGASLLTAAALLTAPAAAHAGPSIVLDSHGDARTGARVAVDAAGTGHVVWQHAGEGSDVVTDYCRLPKGATACAGGVRQIAAVANVSGHTGSDSVAILLAPDGHTLRLVSLGASTGTAGAHGETLKTSTDGGLSFKARKESAENPASAGDLIASNPYDGSFYAAAALSPDGKTVLQATGGAGDFASAADLAGPVRSGHANLYSGANGSYSFGTGAVWPAGGAPVVAAEPAVQNRIALASAKVSDTAGLNVTSNWTPFPAASAAVIGGDPALATGPKGTFLLDTDGRSDVETAGLHQAADPRQLAIRPVTAGVPGSAVDLGATTVACDRCGHNALAQTTGTGELVAVERTAGSRLLLRRSTDGGATWSPAVDIRGDEAAPSLHLQLAVAPDGSGWLVGLGGGTVAVNLDAVPDAPTAGPPAAPPPAPVAPVPPAPSCTVPALAKLPFAVASGRLAAAHCRVGRVTYALGSKMARDRVVASRLHAGSSTIVDLTLSARRHARYAPTAKCLPFDRRIVFEHFGPLAALTIARVTLRLNDVKVAARPDAAGDLVLKLSATAPSTHVRPGGRVTRSVLLEQLSNGQTLRYPVRSWAVCTAKGRQPSFANDLKLVGVD